jgi:hypothetical protein
MTKNIIQDECEIIRQNCEYTAEAHHISARNSRNLAFWLQLIPTLIAAGSAGLVVGQVIPIWWGWATLLSALISAFANVANPLEDYYKHLIAAKSFVVLKHDVRYAKDTQLKMMKKTEFNLVVDLLHNRYGELVRNAPITDDKVFEQARKRIQSGIYKPDKS